MSAAVQPRTELDPLSLPYQQWFTPQTMMQSRPSTCPNGGPTFHPAHLSVRAEKSLCDRMTLKQSSLFDPSVLLCCCAQVDPDKNILVG